MPYSGYQHEKVEDEAGDVGFTPGLNPRLMADNGDSDNRKVRKRWTSFVFGDVEYKFCMVDEGLVYIKKIKGKIVEVELVDLDPGATQNPPEPRLADE
jgi:hypothetical protein